MSTFKRLTALATLTAVSIVATLAFTGCTTTPSRVDAPPRALMTDTFAAHGGLDRFRAQRQLSYTMKGFPLSPPMARPNRSTVDLLTRRNRIDGDGFTVGFDGTDAWATPGPDAVGLPSRFVTLGSFYFIGMPFVFGDEGATLRPGGTRTFRGKTYDVVNVAYEHGTGHTSADDYVAFIDPSTKRLALIHHSVTENPDVDRVTWTFDEWQRVDGLVIPARMTFYAGWNPTDPGQGAAFTIEHAEFSLRAPLDSIYLAPTGAVVSARTN